METFEMWIWQRIISWQDKMTNEEVLSIVGEGNNNDNNEQEKELDWAYIENTRTDERCDRGENGGKET